MSVVKGQGRCVFGCDVVYPGRTEAAEWQLAFATLLHSDSSTGRACKKLVLICGPTHIAAQLEWTLLFPSVFSISLPGV